MTMGLLTSVCGVLSSGACASLIASALNPFFVSVGILVFLVMVFQVIYVSIKAREKKKVFWVGVILVDVVILALLLIMYLLFSSFIVWLGVV